MKKNTLTTALLAGLAGVAGIANVSNAVNLNPDGLGQVLIYPYYTVNAGNDTLISVVNTTNLGKAVKVRILEGRNSREVLDFNLYLSAFDVWTAAISTTGAAATDPGGLSTSDRSCTVPDIVTNATLPLVNGRRVVAFRNTEYALRQPDLGPNDLGRTREGHIELIEMGTIEPGTDTEDEITHVDGVPLSCRDLDANFLSGIWRRNGGDLQDEILAPSGGLFGGAAIVNAPNGTYSNYNADAIDGFRVVSAHSFPGDTLPSLAQARTCNTAAGCPFVGNPAVNVPFAGAQSIVFDNGSLIASRWQATPSGALPTSLGGAIDAVSTIFMADNVMNEYVATADGTFKSEWVVTFPTKRYYVDQDQSIPAGGAVAPFTSIFRREGGGFVDGTGRACEPITITSFDREERTPGFGLDFSPLPPEGFTVLCFEAQVIAFRGTGTTSRILGSTFAQNVDPLFDAGWVNINLAVGQGSLTTTIVHTSRRDLDGDQYNGLPVTGYWALQIDSNNARPGVQGFYGGASRHRVTRDCVNGTGICQ